MLDIRHVYLTGDDRYTFASQLLADTQLIGLILVLLLMDTLVVGLWVALDPLERHLYNLARVVSSVDRSVVYQPQVNNKTARRRNPYRQHVIAYRRDSRLNRNPHLDSFR